MESYGRARRRPLGGGTMGELIDVTNLRSGGGRLFLKDLIARWRALAALALRTDRGHLGGSSRTLGWS